MTWREELGWNPVASMDHVLRDPLSAMAGYVELLLMGAHGPLRPEQVHALEAVRENLDAVVRASEEVLEYASFQRDERGLAVTRVEVGEILETASDSLREELEAKGWALELHPPGEKVPVLGDPHLIPRIVRGMAHLPTRSGRGRILISWHRAGEDGEIRVTRDGNGDQAELTWSVPLGSSTRGPSPALARLLALAMGGTIETNTSEGPGTGSLVLRLPGGD